LTALLSLVFFVSGAAALIFETLWFRQAGLMLGNSVWASSLVTSSFMGGLAIGNALAGAQGRRLRRPIVTYALLEGAIAVAGLGLIMLLPGLTGSLAPLLTPLLDAPVALNAVRFLVAFALLLIPATAMGATLPLLAGALSTSEPRFARVLGMLYGFNTLGAVAGALIGEGFLIERFGVRGTALCAVVLNAAAAASALRLSRRFEGRGREEGSASGSPAMGGATRRLLAAAFLAGGLLLALEVAWFRLLLLFAYGTSIAFAVMLAVVLLGIGLGGLLGGLRARADADAWPWLSALALAGGAATAWTYAALPDALARHANVQTIVKPETVLLLALSLMLPTSLLSGALFTLMGAAVKAEGGGAARAAGALAFSNTTGAMLGPLTGTFVLLPGLGLERTIFLLSAGYGVVALLAASPARLKAETPRLAKACFWIAATAFTALLALFPFGLMRNRLALRPSAPFLASGHRIEAYREGLTETVTYLARDLWGEVTAHRLLTNSHSMSGTHFASARYMRYFVYLPVALRPAPRKALLISYGVGLTARALVDNPALQRIDVVDISKDILELGRVVFPAPGTFPLDDPRVRVHVEDGRFFLLTTDQRFDLITAEPPPPKGAGVVNLYSQEYFQLIRRRLAPGGLVSYWLPVYQMTVRESKAIVHGFCAVFEDCSLWTGTGLEWMLVGSAGPGLSVSEEDFTRQWRDPVTGPELRALGFERPEFFGTTFLADAPALRRLTDSAEPLDDDHPLRLSPRFAPTVDHWYFQMMDVEETRAAFASSAWIRAVWPAALRERTLGEFETQRLINQGSRGYGEPALYIAEAEAILTRTSLRVPVLSAFFTSDAETGAARRAAARGRDDRFIAELLAFDALGDRDYSRAADFFLKAEGGGPAGELRALRVLSLGLASRLPEARKAISETKPPTTPADQATWAWLARRFGAPPSSR
jgi:predicted membrane-bound spermidine synthase